MRLGSSRRSTTSCASVPSSAPSLYLQPDDTKVRDWITRHVAPHAGAESFGCCCRVLRKAVLVHWEQDSVASGSLAGTMCCNAMLSGLELGDVLAEVAVAASYHGVHPVERIMACRPDIVATERRVATPQAHEARRTAARATREPRGASAAGDAAVAVAVCQVRARTLGDTRPPLPRHLASPAGVPARQSRTRSVVGRSRAGMGAGRAWGARGCGCSAGGTGR